MRENNKSLDLHFFRHLPTLLKEELIGLKSLFLFFEDDFKSNSIKIQKMLFLLSLFLSTTMNAQKTTPYYRYSQNQQTLEAHHLPQKIAFSDSSDSSETTFVVYDSHNRSFRIIQKGHYKIQTGIAFRHQLRKNLAPNQTIELTLQLVDEHKKVLESVTYVASRYAIPETVYIQTSKRSYFFDENSTFSVQIIIVKGAKELGTGPHILTDETAPFSKFITIENL